MKIVSLNFQQVPMCFQPFVDIIQAVKHGKRAPPKCKTQGSRAVAFQLLLAFATDSIENTEFLCNLIRRHHLEGNEFLRIQS